MAVLRGGPSTEHEVSLKSGLGVITALKDEGYDVKDIIITKKGEWLVHGIVKAPQKALLDVDVVFNALHGAYGEDGTVQRLLERHSIPYTGSTSYASAIAMNKALTKDFLKKHSNVRMASHVKINREAGANIAAIVHNISELFGPEYVIKPVGGGSSIGTILTTTADLFSSVNTSLKDNEEIIVEQRIRGKEATVGILENFRNTSFYQLPPVEIIPPQNAAFFSHEVKYNGETEEICPGRFSKEEKQQLQNAAEEVHRVLGLRQYSRSDFIVADDGIYFLEVNTLPGLTSESLFPKSMEAVGSSYKELVAHLLQTI